MFSVFNCFKTLARRSRKQSRRSQKQEPKPSAVNPVTHRKESIQNSKPASAIPIDDDEAVGTVGIAECAELETVGNSGNPENALTDEPETTGATEEPLEQHDTDEHQLLIGRPPNPNGVPGIVVERQATLLAETVATIPSIQRSPSDVSLTPNLSRGNSQTSQSSSRSQPGSKSPSSGRHWLKQQLDLAALESPIHEFCFLIPKSALEELITVTNVAEDIQARDPSIGGPEATSLANKVCRCAPRLYATLAYIKKGADIKGLLAEDVTDDDLPFVRKANDPRKFALYRCNGKAIQTLDLWVDKYLQRFDRHQWWMNAPVFKQNEDLYELDKTTVLPFVNFEPPKGTVRHNQAGYSEVYPVRIHPAHHDFWASSGPVHEEPLVAVKQLYSEDEEEFEKERSILTAMTMKNHPHLIKLLATYKYKGKYHLMFPLANSNLRQYWDQRPKPAFDKETVLWSLQQMAGIANGLLRVHTYKVTHPLSIPGFGNMRVQSDVQLSVKKGEERYGRHGDIKPENVLWFAQNSEAQGSKGILQIADFGLGRFHGRESRSRVPPESVSSSPTYEPPECKLRLPVSRAYDMWSLGCLYLEFITWLLKGTAQIWEFSDFRGGQAIPNTIDDDNFFTLTTGTEGPKATVRKQVVTWANDLHGHERCSLLIHDLLDLTMKGLLVVEVSGRYPASWLYFKLEECLKRAEMDEDYVLKPAPRKLMPEPERANTDPGASTLPKTKPKPNSKRNSVVTFADEKPTMKEIVHTTLPRDLVLRKSAMKTWPTHGPQRKTMVVALP